MIAFEKNLGTCDWRDAFDYSRYFVLCFAGCLRLYFGKKLENHIGME